MTMTYNEGLLRTDLFPSDQVWRDVDPKLYMQYAAEAPFLTFMEAVTGKPRKVKAFKYEHEYQGRNARQTAVASLTGTTVVNVTAGTGKYFSPNDQMLNVTTSEIVNVVSVSTDAVTVDRDVSGTGLDWTAADVLVRLAKNVPEGGTASDSVNVQPETWYNYIQQIDQTLEMSWLAIESQFYAENSPEKTRFEEAIKEHMRSVNTAILFSILDSTASSGGGYRRSMNGIQAQVSNTLSCTDLTEPSFRTHLGTLAQYSNKPRLLVGGPNVLTMLEAWGMADRFVEDTKMQDEFGFEVLRYRNGYFPLKILIDYTFSDCGYANNALIVDLSETRLVEMIPRIVIKDFKKDGTYKKQHVVYWAVSIETTHPHAGSKLTGVNTSS